jgi:hypothetical protein
MNFTDALMHPGQHAAEVRNAQLTKELNKLTRGWTTPLIMRTYPAGSKGEAALVQESEVFIPNGYEPSLMSEDGGHVHVGRLLLTGGLSIFAGKKGIRSNGKRTITWRKQLPRREPGTWAAGHEEGE